LLERATTREAQAFWGIAGAWLEALASEAVSADLFAKRTASRLSMQVGAVSRGDASVSERLALDMLFFCALVRGDASKLPALAAVRRVHGLVLDDGVQYQKPVFGLVDPALIQQGRKRLAAAKDGWTAITGGEVGKARSLVDQFAALTESLGRIYPQDNALVVTLNRVASAFAQSGDVPRPELGLEVATALLFVEASFEVVEPHDAESADRASRLAQRIESVRTGGPSEPLEAWMEELYRGVSDRQTMGTVVAESRALLAEVEKDLDAFFRNPVDTAAIREVPSRLLQMRGVLSLLGLADAAQASARMRDTVEEILVTQIDPERAKATGTFDKLADNLGGLGLLIDMLSYQPGLAKQLFVFDHDAGVLKPVMGRERRVMPGDAVDLDVGIGEDIPPAAPAVDIGVEIGALVEQAQSGEMATAELATSLDHLSERAVIADDAASAWVARELAQRAVGGADVQSLVAQATALSAPALPLPVEPEAAAVVEDDLRDIFLEEAWEVFVNAREALAVLTVNPADAEQLTVVRRAFHTLKGSSRMVGLTEFGEAAWSMEQVFNAAMATPEAWLPLDLVSLATEAFDTFEPWVDAIRRSEDGAFRAQAFQQASVAFRERGERLALSSVGAPLLRDAVTLEPSEPVATSIPLPSIETIDVAEAPIDDLPTVFDVQSHPARASGVSQPTMKVDPPAPAAEAVDFVFDLSDLAPVQQPVPVAEAGPLTVDVAGVLIDSEFLAIDADATTKPVPELGLDTDAPPAVLKVTELVAPDAPNASVPAEPLPSTEDVRVVGPLRIGIALYNVYLNEADEKSRRLSTELAEWAVVADEPVGETAVMDAHSLAGGSATVGFEELARLAQTLELAMLRNRERGVSMAPEPQVFTAAADEIRRLLHQFAAGFLKPVNESVWIAFLALDALPTTPISIAHESELPTDAIDVDLEPTPPLTAVPVSNVVDRPDFGLLTDQPDDEDDIDAVDAPDADLFPIFDEEARELMPQLSAQLRALQASPGDRGALAAALRSLHTLKGSARLAGAMRVGELAHRMESDIEHLTQSDGAVTADGLRPVVARFDAIEAALEGLRARDAAAYSQALEQVETVAASSEKGVAVQTHEPGSAVEAAATAPVSAVSPVVVRDATPTTPVARGSLTGNSVRVRTLLLDRLVDQAGEVSIARSRLEAELSQLKQSVGDMTDNLERMRQHLRDIELQGETQMQSRLAAAREAEEGFDPLEMDRFTRFQELTRMMAESVNDFATVQRTLQRTVENTEDDLVAQARLTRDLQRDLLRTRMVEFDSISERLYRLVRMASKEADKQVRLDVQGGNIEIDRSVLDRMAPAFEHLLRNCIAHGVEPTSAREAAGKDPVGTITVSLRQAGNDVSVTFADDGAGIDTARVRERAVRLGLLDAQSSPSEAELMQMIFTPGFSTATEVTELAGRGIGMDVVRSEVNGLGGRIDTSSQRGQGTRFEMVLPLTTAVTQVVMLRVGELTVGVPANLVEIVRRATPDEVRAGYAQGHMRVAAEEVPFHWLGALLQGAPRGGDLAQRTLPVVVLRSAAQRVAVHVDEVLGNQEVVVKNLGPQLSRLPGLAGMSVLASGAIVLIYNPVALATVYGEQAREAFVAHDRQAAETGSDAAAVPIQPSSRDEAVVQAPLVLVVDDSITVRRVTQRLLQREGYRVELAKDGLDALEKLQGERPCVVLSDIEMPRMDGFDLARTIRGDKALRSLPLVMITSRLADKHREYAREIGTDHYLGKPYSEEELLALVKRYAAHPFSALTAEAAPA
jgi:chemosensory pili system protein ChpA (sensor histidine kinase/response regulator)